MREKLLEAWLHVPLGPVPWQLGPGLEPQRLSLGCVRGGPPAPNPNAGVRPGVLRGPCRSGVHPLSLTVPLPCVWGRGGGRGWRHQPPMLVCILRGPGMRGLSPLHLWGLGPLCALPEASQSLQQLPGGL